MQDDGRPRGGRQQARAQAPLVAIMLVSLVGAGCGSAPPSLAPATPQVSVSPPPVATPSHIDGGLQPDPRAPNYALRDPWAPARMTGTTHELELAIAERYRTVANGYVMYLWTIGGTVPGPVVRVQASDTVRVHLINHPPKGSYPEAHEAVNEYPHSVEFDGSAGGWADQLTPIEPGGDRIVEFTTPTPGVWMYHGTQPVLQSIANGMYGMMIVEPEGGLDSVAQEFIFVQGEWYVDASFPSGPQLPSLKKAAAPNPSPDFVVLNGAAGQYLDNPIQVETGERVRVFILNAGPNLNMAFRVEGAVFDRVIKDGVEVDRRADQGLGSAEVDLSPGRGAVVEFVLATDGTYRILNLDAAGGVAEGLFEAVSERM